VRKLLERFLYLGHYPIEKDIISCGGFEQSKIRGNGLAHLQIGDILFAIQKGADGELWIKYIFSVLNPNYPSAV